MSSQVVNEPSRPPFERTQSPMIPPPNRAQPFRSPEKRAPALARPQRLVRALAPARPQRLVRVLAPARPGWLVRALAVLRRRWTPSRPTVCLPHRWHRRMSERTPALPLRQALTLAGAVAAPQLAHEISVE